MHLPSRVLAVSGRLLAPFVLGLSMQQTLAQSGSSGTPIRPAPADPSIAAALAQISPDRIHAIIEKLVSFNNRSTLSSMETDLAPGTGINAAADWVASEFERISASCGDCLEVRRDEFTEPGSDVAGLAHPEAGQADQCLRCFEGKRPRAIRPPCPRHRPL